MSVIENPVAHMNETHPGYQELTPMTKPVSSLPLEIERDKELLDETPLSSNRNRSPRKLSTEEVPLSSAPALINKQLLVVDVSAESNGGREVADEAGEEKFSVLDMVKKSVEEEDEDFNPNKTEEEGVTDDKGLPGEEEKKKQSVLTRSYYLRDGVKGTVEKKDELKQVSHDEAEKKKADDLWTAFKADVALPIKRKAKELENVIREKTYYFAGESVAVEEPDMQPPSKRRSIVLNLGYERKRRRESEPLLSRPAPRIAESSEEGSTVEVSTAPGRGSRHASKLNSLVNRLTKKPTMTVLNKTALDWGKYKSEHNIEDDVKNESKSEGYLEKQDFVNRSNVRQFELEREIRQQQQRRRQMMNSKHF